MKRTFASLALSLLLFALTGCGESIPTNNKDARMLADLPSAPDPTPSAQILPLKSGNRWHMTTRIEDTLQGEVYTVGKPVQIEGQQGIAIDAARNGQLWRREVYQQTAAGLSLLAFGDSGKPLMSLTPPLKITGPTVAEGDSVRWSGTIKIKGRAVPAHGFSRVSLQESVQTRAGIHNAFRIDTILTIPSPNAEPTHFPSIRWLAPRIGFVRRSYVDNNKGAISELDRMELR